MKVNYEKIKAASDINIKSGFVILLLRYGIKLCNCYKNINHSKNPEAGRFEKELPFKGFFFALGNFDSCFTWKTVFGFVDFSVSFKQDYNRNYSDYGKNCRINQLYIEKAVADFVLKI